MNAAPGLHPDAVAYLSSRARSRPDFPPEAASDIVVAQTYLRELRGSPTEEDNNREIVEISSQLRARVYRPSRLPCGIVLVFHGGGFVAGTLDSETDYCTLTAERANVVVLSVGYRLAPEHPYPAAAEDARTAIAWALQYAAMLGAPPRLAVVGSSAGGAIAAGACLSLDPSVSSVHHLTLFYPALSPELNTASAAQYASGYGLAREQMRWFWDAYLAEIRLRMDSLADAAPGLSDDLGGLPSMNVVVAEFDILHDEAAHFVDDARSCGVDAELVHARGHVHGFLNYCRTSSDVQQYAAQEADVIRRKLAHDN